MSFPVESFWNLVVESHLMTLDECHRYHAAWVSQNPHGDAHQLAEWLFAQNVISRYQASILLAGRAGPFVYGDYKIYDRIETGRLKGIFRAVHIASNHTVCLQFLTADQAATPDRVARLSQQAVLTSRSSAGFPHLLRCYHLVDLGTYKFFVLEDLQGKRVERILSKEGARPQSEACSIARQIAAGLGRLHAMHQAHGDVRPANIWVDAGGTIKLMQFPLSRDPLAAPLDWKALVASSSTAVPPEADYVAPELITGGKPDARSDIYQLGCSLYAMLTNRVPFPGKSLREKLEGHLKQTPVPIEELNPSISPALSKVVGYMMQKKPELRYQQTSTVIEKLLPFMTPADAQSQPTPPTRAAQQYDAWLHERLSVQASSPAAAAMHHAAAHPAQPGMPMQTMPMQAAPMQAAAAPAYGQPYGGASPYAPAPQAAQPAYPQSSPFGAPMPPAMAAAAAPAASPFAPAQAFPAIPEPEPQPGLGPGPTNAPSYAPPGSSAAPASYAASAPRSQGNNSSKILMIAIFVTLLVVGGGIAVMKSGSDNLTVTQSAGTKPVVAPPKGTAAGTATNAPIATPTATAEVKPAEPPPPKGTVIPVRDTFTALGEPMWDSPTAGKQLDLSFLCRGSSLVVAVRPADLMKHAESERLLDEKVLGAIAPWYQTTLPQWAGVSHDQIEQAIVGVLDGPAPRYACVIRLKQPATEDQLVQVWGNPTAEQADDVKYYVKENLAYYLPAGGKGQVVVVAPKEEMPDLLMLKGAPGQLAPRELNVLLQSTDADRHLTVVFSPHFLEAGGKSLLAGPFERGVTAMNWLFTGYGLPALGETATPPPAMPNEAEPPKAAMFSAHLASNGAADDIFWEVRIYQPTANSITESAVGPLASRVKEIGARVEQYYISLSASPYSKAVLYKYPPMVKFFCNNVRAAAADKQFILRGTGPDVSAHNIVLGARLCLFETPGGYVASVPTTGPSTGGATGTPKQSGVLDALRSKKMALSFDRNDLNKILDIVSNELGYPIEMHGDDFRLAGITKNQSMGLMEPEQTLDKLMMTILKKANMDGQLVYMGKTDPDGSEKLLILTRKGAADRKEQLPPEFAAPK